MVKIPRNRQDSEMVGDLPEAESFEHLSDGTASRPAAKSAAKPAKQPDPGYAAFFTPELAEEVGKALLTLKVNLYKQGIVDYRLKVSCEADQVVLKAVPAGKQPKER